MRAAELAALRERLCDDRSGKVVFISHCLLNENVRYLGGAFRPAMVDEIVEDLRRTGIGVHQMSCPEQLAWGGVLKRRLLPVYGSAGTLRHHLRGPLRRLFLWRSRLVYDRLARRVVRQVADYRRAGMTVVAIVGVSASPSCGVLLTMDTSRALDVLAGCAPGTADRQRLNHELMRATLTPGAGEYVQRLQRHLARRQIDVPFLEHDLLSEMRGLRSSPFAADAVPARKAPGRHPDAGTPPGPPPGTPDPQGPAQRT